MSFFKDEYIDEVSSAIDYFMRLPEEKKILLITNVNKSSIYSEQEWEIMKPFLIAIQNDITLYTDIKIAQKMYELGMDKDYAQLFIKNIKEKAPTNEYHASVIKDIPDEKFHKIYPSAITLIYLKAKTDEQVAKDLEITIEQVISLNGIFKSALHPYLRREISDEHVIDTCLKLGLSQSKADIILETLKVNAENFKEQITFLNSTDANTELAQLRDEIETLKKRSELTLKILRQLLESIQEKSSGDTPDHIK